MASIKKRRVFCFATETTPGTPATLSSANAMWVSDAMIQPTIKMNERFATGTIGRLPGVSGSRGGKVTFTVELGGGGSSSGVEPAWAVLFPACGMIGASHVYSPTSNPGNFKNVTIGIYETTPAGAVLKRLSGCMGTFTIEGTSGNIATVKFEMTGIWQTPTDATMITVPAQAPIPPRFAQAVFTVGAFSPKINKFSLDFGGKIKLIEDITTASGYAYGLMTDREVKGSIDPQAESVATWDPNGLWIGQSLVAMSLVIGSTAGNTVTLAAPAFQLADVQEADRDELVTSDIKFNLATAVSDDEFSITFA